MGKACGNSKCNVSTGVHGGLTFGSGELDENGFWEHPCGACARLHEELYPEDGQCWPFGPPTRSEMLTSVGHMIDDLHEHMDKSSILLQSLNVTMGDLQELRGMEAIKEIADLINLVKHKLNQTLVLGE